MRLLFAATLLSISIPLTGHAQSVIGAYYATVGPQDRFNSSGAPLGTLGAVLQQDRANVHRFGRGDLSDEVDPFFGDPALRARIPALYAAGDTDPLIEQIVRDGPGLSILVLLCGVGGQLDYLVVDFADGDGNRDC